MNKVEKVIRAISPSWALNRAYKRYSINAYEAAKPSRTNKKKGKGESGEFQVGRYGKTLRDQARWLEENNDLVDGLLSTLVNNIVGKDGISVEPMPLDYEGNIHQGFAKQILQVWSDWSVKPESTGNWTRPEIERLVCRTWLRDGECFGELLQGYITGFKHPNKEVPFSLQVMEPDFFPYSMNKPKKMITQAIQRNQWGQATHYHALLNHPGHLDNYSYRDQTRAISADSILHIRQVKRLHQGRGVSILASTMQRISGLQNYEESELVAARIAAAMAFYIRKGVPEDYESNDAVESRKNMPISPGTIFDDLRPGEDVGTIESKRPNALLQKFRDTMVRAICSATGANFSTVAKQYDGTYSAQRQELVESYLSYGVMSNSFIAQWSRPVYRECIKMALLSGKLTVPPDVDPNTLLLAFYQAPVMPWIDPAKEAKANNEIVAGGFGTEAEVLRARGKNPAETKRQRAAEIAENREKQLVFKSDPYHEYYGAKREENKKISSNGSS